MGQTKSERLFRIDCEDIYLQEFSVEDVDSIYRISNTPEIFDFLPDWKSTKEQRINWMINYEIPANKAFLKAVATTSHIDAQLLKLGVFLKKTNKLIGWCCTGIKDELPLPNREIMYAISKEFQKKGYATKASKGLINYLFTHTDLKFLNAVALSNNISSNKVIVKCGFAPQGQQTIDKEIYNHYILAKSDWYEPVNSRQEVLQSHLTKSEKTDH
ncbi:GNAT family N-acetyltransferase [Planococcus sp. CPCC 101016]|uniref:GNAT family N-acetyltransferase n=1 Tax=Planococcus sp. CPCC 101016 TaxID=2599617 RepID=UPI0011B72EA1|nr:GNAT family N-acetyltransferase [Planococcus sp. CPCC 101016]TWT08237.1 GNAT family N-acetyltransferase [Planococcus sp. CPCC 101016]